MDMQIGETRAQELLRRAKSGDKQAHRKLIDLYIAEERKVSGGSTAPSQLSAQQLNMLQRQAVLAQSIEMTQALPSQTLAAPIAGANTASFNIRNVGMLKKIILEITGTLNNTDGANASTATAFGLANLIQNLTFNDFNNFTRISTDGRHLAVLKQVKHKTTDPGSAPISTIISDALVGGEFVASGSAPNFPVIVYPLPAHGVSAAFRAVFEIPLAYSDNDLRGAMYSNVLNTQAQMIVTINPVPCNTTADATNGVWAGGAGNITNVQITPYQVYLDQLPIGPNGVILPSIDLSTIYELKSSPFSGMVANTEFPFPYANFRDFLSTLILFNSTGATAGLKNGSDVNYFGLQSANLVNIFKIDPLLSAQFTREIIGSDLPLGTYYFSHRKKPISTLQFGNMQLILNAANLTAGSAYATMYVEDFGLQNTLTQAGSLAT